MSGCDYQGPCRSALSGRKWTIVILIILLLGVIIWFVWVGVTMYSQSRIIGNLSLQGYWHIDNNRYLLITGPVVQIIDITPNDADKTKPPTVVELFTAKDAKIIETKYSSGSHTFSISGYTTTVNKLNISGVIDIVIVPAFGVMRLLNIPGKIEEQLIKDNAMTYALLSQL